MHWQLAKGKQYLIFYHEFISAQNRHRLSHKGKYEIYCFEEKSYLSDEFGIPWTSDSFPNLLHVIAVGPKGNRIPEEYLLTAVHQFEHTLFCGGVDGRLHLLKS